MKGAIYKAFSDANRVANDFYRSNTETFIDIINLIVGSFQKGRKLLLFGNGGSAADAQHIAAEFVNRFRLKRNPLPAIALTTDTSIITSVANDRSFERIFSVQLEALGKVDDVAMAISTSGDSPNVLAGVATARKMGLVTVGLTGNEGGSMARECDYCLIVPSEDTPRIQECHILAGHIICEQVELELSRHPVK